MNQTLATNKKYATEHRRFDCGNAIAAQAPERQKKLNDMLWPATIDQFHQDWFAQRLWEDDGGGQRFTGPGRMSGRSVWADLVTAA